MVTKGWVDVSAVAVAAAASHGSRAREDVGARALAAVSKTQQQGDQEAQDEHGSLRHSQRGAPARFHWKITTGKTHQING